MKPAELRTMSDEELTKKLDELQQELFNLRFQFATRQLQNYKKMEEVRRDIARLRTIVRERELNLTPA